jgi:hypothetical protein
MRVLGYAAAARRRRAREYSFSCTPGWRPGVSRAALLHRRLQLSSAQPRAANLRTTAMLDTPLTHGCVHRTERVQQQPSATIIRCVQWMQRSRNHSQSLWRPACRPYSTHNQKPWVQYCTHACFTNHGLCTRCNIAPRIQTMVCTRDANCTPVLQTMVCQTEVQIASLVQFWMFLTTCTKVVFKVVFPCTTASGGHGGRSGGVSAKGSPCQARSCRYGSVTHVPHGVTLTTVVMICMYRP